MCFLKVNWIEYSVIQVVNQMSLSLINASMLNNSIRYPQVLLRFRSFLILLMMHTGVDYYQNFNQRCILCTICAEVVILLRHNAFPSDQFTGWNVLKDFNALCQDENYSLIQLRIQLHIFLTTYTWKKIIYTYIFSSYIC